MSIEALLAATQRLYGPLDLLAALGAQLRLQRDGLTADPRVAALLREIAGTIDPKLLDDVPRDQQLIVLSAIEMAFKSALDLLRNPDRAPGWFVEDADTIQAQGQISRRIVRVFEMLAERQPRLRETLAREGAFLDVGAGAGWLSIEAAAAWPALRVVGIDIWEPALRLARENVAASAHPDRIELRQQSVAELDDREAFTLAWFPGPFIPFDLAETALTRMRDALRPEGWLVFGLFAPLPDRAGELMTALKVVRSGGHPWSTEDAERLLRRLGFVDVETFAPGAVTVIVAGRKPAGVSAPAGAG